MLVFKRSPINSKFNISITNKIINNTNNKLLLLLISVVTFSISVSSPRKVAASTGSVQSDTMLSRIGLLRGYMNAVLRVRKVFNSIIISTHFLYDLNVE